MWKFENSDKEVEVEIRYKKISSKLGNNGMIRIPKDIISHLAKQTGIPKLHNNCALVLDIVGIMLPPNIWYKLKEKK